MSELWDASVLNESCGTNDKKAGVETVSSLECENERVKERNDYLKNRYIIAINNYRDLCSKNSEEHRDTLSSLPYNAMQTTLSYLSTNDLFSLRIVCRRLRNWAEFEMKSRKKTFMVTKNHKTDYEIFLQFKLFSNIQTLVIDSLSSGVQLNNLLRLCKDFLSDLEHIVVEGFEEYMAIVSFYPLTGKRVASTEEAQKVLSEVTTAYQHVWALNKFNTVNYLYGLKGDCLTCDEQILRNEIDSYRKRNTFLRDKLELLEKECSRMKSEENLSEFKSLPEEVILKILEYLDKDDCFRLRLVSKELKYWAEMALKTRKQTLYISLTSDSSYRIYLWSKIYSNIKTLTVDGTELTLDVFFSLCGDNLLCLESLTICSCDQQNITVIGDYFPCLKSLTLRYNETISSDIPTMLSKLRNLASFTMNGSLPTATSEPKFICFNGTATNLQSFTYECLEYLPFDLSLVSETLKTELPNLKELHLNLPWANVFNFFQLTLDGIKELDLSCCRIEGTLTLSNEAKSVEKLILNTESNNDKEVATVLRNFTHLNTLQLDLFRNREICFSFEIIDAIRSLKSLKFFALFDAFYGKSKYFTLDNGTKSALIEVLSSLDNVSKFKVEFCQQSYEDEDLLKAVNKLTAKNPHQDYELIIPDNEFDLYDSFSEASVASWDSYVGSGSDHYDSDFDITYMD